MTGKGTRAGLGLIILLLFWGCASTGVHTARTAELLAKSYAAMPDQELEVYYFQLNDQIARVERAGRSAAVPGGEAAAELRERRDEVRAELSRRGLRP